MNYGTLYRSVKDFIDYSERVKFSEIDKIANLSFLLPAGLLLAKLNATIMLQKRLYVKYSTYHFTIYFLIGNTK